MTVNNYPTRVAAPRSEAGAGSVAGAGHPPAPARPLAGRPGLPGLRRPELHPVRVFSYWPVGYNAYLSLTDWNMIAPVKRFVGLDNYTDMFTGAEFREVALAEDLIRLVVLC